jgi:hypothetical protein
MKIEVPRKLSVPAEHVMWYLPLVVAIPALSNLVVLYLCIINQGQATAASTIAIVFAQLGMLVFLLIWVARIHSYYARLYINYNIPSKQVSRLKIATITLGVFVLTGIAISKLLVISTVVVFVSMGLYLWILNLWMVIYKHEYQDAMQVLNSKIDEILKIKRVASYENKPEVKIQGSSESNIPLSGLVMLLSKNPLEGNLKYNVRNWILAVKETMDCYKVLFASTENQHLIGKEIKLREPVIFVDISSNLGTWLIKNIK